MTSESDERRDWDDSVESSAEATSVDSEATREAAASENVGAGVPRPAAQPVRPDRETFESWFDDMRGVIERGLEELAIQVTRFLTDLQEQSPDLHVERMQESLRDKSVDRILTKAERRGVLDPEALLTRCYLARPGAEAAFPVGDLLGLRVLVRSLRDVDVIKAAVLARRNIGDADAVAVDDINAHPRPSGYRALHIDGTVTFDKSGDSFDAALRGADRNARPACLRAAHARGCLRSRRTGQRPPLRRGARVAACDGRIAERG